LIAINGRGFYKSRVPKDPTKYTTKRFNIYVNKISCEFVALVEIEMTANSGTAFKGQDESFVWKNAFETLTGFLDSKNEKELLKAIKESARESVEAWPGSKIVKVQITEDLAVKLFNLLENLTKSEQQSSPPSYPPDDLFGVRTELLKKLDIKKVKFDKS
jgi:hypothetical protein